MRKLLFLWLLVFSISATVIGQTLNISSSGYENQNVTDGVVNVRSGTVVTIVATLPVGATQTYWTSSVGLTAIDPSQTFPIGPTSLVQVSFEMPLEDEVIITVAFNTSPMTSSFVVLTRNDNIATGLLPNQAVSDCPGVVLNFPATQDHLTGFVYTWQEWNGSSWGNLGASSYYSAMGRVLNIQLHSSIEGKLFKCIVTNPNCLGAIDQVLVEVVDVYFLPTATFSPGTNICLGEEVELVVTPDNGTAPYSVTMNNGTGDLTNPNNINPVLGVGSGGTANFSVFPQETITYRFTITDSNGCSRTY